jgi:dienelactone hydrolase
MQGSTRSWAGIERTVKVPAGAVLLDGTLSIPKDATGIVVFVHGSGSSRTSPRNRFVAEVLNEAGLATLLFDLLTPNEEQIDNMTAQLRFNIPFLAERVMAVKQWLYTNPETSSLAIGYFGASTGAAAALVAAALAPESVKAIVSRGGRPDLAGNYLRQVLAPTLLIVGGNDHVVIDLNNSALAQMTTEKKLTIVPGATHLFEEPGTLEQVAEHASAWFSTKLC